MISPNRIGYFKGPFRMRDFESTNDGHCASMIISVGLIAWRKSLLYWLWADDRSEFEETVFCSSIRGSQWVLHNGTLQCWSEIVRNSVLFIRMHSSTERDSSPKNTNSVINYSPSCCFKPVRPSKHLQILHRQQCNWNVPRLNYVNYFCKK